MNNMTYRIGEIVEYWDGCDFCEGEITDFDNNNVEIDGDMLYPIKSIVSPPKQPSKVEWKQSKYDIGDSIVTRDGQIGKINEIVGDSCLLEDAKNNRFWVALNSIKGVYESKTNTTTYNLIDNSPFKIEDFIL
jgi:preprotein translocase subunit YajC